MDSEESEQGDPLFEEGQGFVIETQKRVLQCSNVIRRINRATRR